MRLNFKERALVRERLEAIKSILSSPKRSVEIARIAREKSLAGERGWSEETLDRLLRKFLAKGGDWHVLMRNYKGKSNGVPQELIEHFSERILQSPTGTSAKAAYRELIYDFSRGVSIPGIGTKYEWAERTGRPVPNVYATSGELPDGMSYRNLIRKLPKNQYAKEIISRGIAFAHSSEPDMVLRTRKHLRFLEWIAFDDVRLDNRCIIDNGKGKRVIGYPLSVFALDVATGCDIAHLCLPRMRRDKDGSTFGIASEDVRILVVNIIREYGLPTYPINLCIENSAATLSEADELAIKQTFGDHILIHRCGTLHDRWMKNGFYEKGGKPWSKGWVEVFFRGLQEHLSLITGATGRRYDSIPARVKACEEYLKKVFGEIEGNEDLARKLVSDIPTFDDICDAIMRILDVLQHRTDHQLEGFKYIQKWRKNKFDTLHEIDELKFLSDNELDKIEIIERLESPFERKQRLKNTSNFVHIPACYYAHLYALKVKTIFKIRSGGLFFESKKIKRHKCEKILENLVFDAPSYDIIEKYTGVEVLCYFEDDLSAVHITKDGAYICVLPRKESVNPLDKDAVRERIIEVQQRRLTDRAKVAQITPTADQNLAFMKEENLKLLKEAKSLNVSKNKNSIFIKEKQNNKTDISYKTQTNRFARQAAIARDADEDF